MAIHVERQLKRGEVLLSHIGGLPGQRMGHAVSAKGDGCAAPRPLFAFLFTLAAQRTTGRPPSFWLNERVIPESSESALKE
jgi:hypothetical protein